MISLRTKQKSCNLSKVQVEVQIGKVIFNSIINDKFIYFIQKDILFGKIFKNTLLDCIYGFIEHRYCMILIEMFDNWLFEKYYQIQLFENIS